VDTIGHGPEIGGVVAVEMLLNIEAKAWEPRAKCRMHVAPVIGEKCGRQAIPAANRGIDIVAHRFVAV
jgi:hypothetical protein